jgi:hypothetical protein
VARPRRRSATPCGHSRWSPSLAFDRLLAVDGAHATLRGSAFWALLALLIVAFVALLGLHNSEHGPVVSVAIALIFFIWVAPLAPWKLSLSLHTLADARRAAHIPDFAVRVSLSGLEVNVPTSEDECWDTPIPCTTHYSDRLALLEPGHMSAGFYMLPAESP